MSHFSLLVLVGPDKANLPVEEALNQLLAPYDENMEVEVYKRPCYCIGQAARHRVFDRLSAEARTAHPAVTQILLDRAQAERDEVAKSSRPSILSFAPKVGWLPNYWDVNREYRRKMEGTDDEKKKYWQVLVERRDALVAAEPDAKSPDASCEDCNATGEAPTQYNPQSKWDWWQIGGSWQGVLDGYKPDEDPKNIEECTLCSGTGKRVDDIGNELRAKDPTFQCNGCDGKGKRPLWPTQCEHHHGDIQPAVKLSKELVQDRFYAILTPNGEWHENAEMGMFAATGPEKDTEEVWKEKKWVLVSAHPDAMAVIVDCHI